MPCSSMTAADTASGATRRARSCTRYPSYDVQGRHIEELEEMGIFTPSVAKRVFREQREITIIHENKNGKKLLTTGTPIFNGSDEISNIITTSRDITRLTDKGQLPPASKPVIDVNSMEQSVVPKSGMIAASVAMQNVMTLTNRLATVNSTVLITGESGVGKGLIAKLLHKKGNRSSGPFITVNCGAIPENLIESELFGYVPGAFTGSRSDGKSGLFEAAQNGTIFLDEISELPLNLQVKLLRVIQGTRDNPCGRNKDHTHRCEDSFRYKQIAHGAGKKKVFSEKICTTGSMLSQ